jgi:transposase
MSDLALDENEIPESFRELNNADEVDQIVEYQSGYADYSIILSEIGTKQFVRVFWLRYLRDEWEWVQGTDDGVGFVLLKVKQ